MKKIAIVYWSGTGNTRAMARKVAEGASREQVQATLFTVSEFDADMAGLFDALAFGCPAMGAETLEEHEFEPVFQACLPKLHGKPLVLFGSYGWGDGTWMRDWEAVCTAAGAPPICESVICVAEPDGEAEDACMNLGRALSQAIC